MAHSSAYRKVAVNRSHVAKPQPPQMLVMPKLHFFPELSHNRCRLPPAQYQAYWYSMKYDMIASAHLQYYPTNYYLTN